MFCQPREEILVTWVGSVSCQAKEWEEICQYERVFRFEKFVKKEVWLGCSFVTLKQREVDLSDMRINFHWKVGYENCSQITFFSKLPFLVC